MLGYLAKGGTERQVAYLSSELVQRGHAVRVLLLGRGTANDYPVADGVQVQALQITKLRHCVAGWRELRAAFHRSDVVYSFLDIANAFCALAKPKQGAPLIWGLRAANTSTGRFARFGLWLSQRLLARADALVANAQAVQAYYQTQGIGGARVSVITNGVQLPDADAALATPKTPNPLRAELGLPDESYVALVLARSATEKRQELGLQLLEQHRGLHLIFAGAGVSALPQQWQAQNQVLATPSNLERCRFLEHTADVGRLLGGVDVLLSLSAAEGLPNAVLEAMAYEVPVVATAVGGVVELLAGPEADARRRGWLVSGASEPALVQALVQALVTVEAGGAEVQLRIHNARQSIEEHYGIKVMVDQTELLLDQLANRVSG